MNWELTDLTTDNQLTSHRELYTICENRSIMSIQLLWMSVVDCKKKIIIKKKIEKI